MREKNQNYAGFLWKIMREKMDIMREIMRDEVIA